MDDIVDKRPGLVDWPTKGPILPGAIGDHEKTESREAYKPSSIMIWENGVYILMALLFFNWSTASRLTGSPKWKFPK